MKYLFERIKQFIRNSYSFFFRGQVVMSSSRYNVYSSCPLKYEFHYEQGLKGFPSADFH
jgi:hypothetical protein